MYDPTNRNPELAALLESARKKARDCDEDEMSEDEREVWEKHERAADDFAWRGEKL